MYTQKPPQLFPINDPHATYTVIKTGNEYSINYRTDRETDLNRIESCNWIERKLNCKTQYIKDLTATVGLSPKNLEYFVGKQVSVTGSFGTTGKEGNRLFINISSIEEKK